jgi:uncharacterized protein YjiS (DUF1127 family)
VSTNHILRSTQGMTNRHWRAALLNTIKVAIETYTNWRADRAAVAMLSSMDDQMLKDIGLSRCQITGAVTTGHRDNVGDEWRLTKHPLKTAA